MHIIPRSARVAAGRRDPSGHSQFRGVERRKAMQSAQVIGGSVRRRAPGLFVGEPASENRGQEEFLAVISHELRSPLGAIRNAVALLDMQDAGAAVHQKARICIKRQVGRMARLLEDILEAARAGGGRLPLKRERLDLRDIVWNAIETVESNLDERKQRLTVALPDTPVWLQAEPGRLEQVLVNLLVNAAKFTGPGGAIGVSVRQEHDEAVVCVRDSGIGIAPEMLPRVFDLFMQIEPSARHSGTGLGIGLALVRRFVELHGGRVSAASDGLGRGSEFTVRLPIG